eukprot:gene40445-53471_t
MELLTEINRDDKTTFLISTHDERIAERCRRQIRMLDGGEDVGGVGIAGLVGVDIPNFTGQAPGNLVMEALAFLFLRQGLKSPRFSDDPGLSASRGVCRNVPTLRVVLNRRVSLALRTTLARLRRPNLFICHSAL